MRPSPHSARASRSWSPDVPAPATAVTAGTADASNPVSMTLWTNATTGPGAAFFTDTVKSFETANPGVTIKIQTVQNEDLDGKLQTALNSGDAPDIFLQRGGGKMAAMVDASQLMDITDSISADTKAGVGEGSFKAESIDGKTYAMPVVGPARWLLLQPGPVQGGRHHHAADHARRAQRGEHQAQGERRLADRARRQGRLARRALVLLVRAARVQRGHAGLHRQVAEVRRPLLDQGRQRPQGVPEVRRVQRRLPDAPRRSRVPARSAGLIANHKAGAELMGAWDPGVIGSLTPGRRSRCRTSASTRSSRCPAARVTPRRSWVASTATPARPRRPRRPARTS